MAEVFAVVVAYRNPQMTLKCVQALLAQTASMRVVVWDNNSGDATVPMLRNIGGIILHESPDNDLWTPAINMAIQKYYDGERTICWLNNDAFPHRTCMERLDTVLGLDGVGMAAPMTSNIGGPQDVTSNPAVHEILMAHPDDPDAAVAHLNPRRATFVLGACSAVTGEVWERVGPLAWDMPLGADDHDYSIRVKELGYKIAVVQSALCDHKGHASARDGGSPVWDEQNGKCWDTFNQKYGGYYFNEEEAIKCHWGGVYHPGWDRGTGWMEPDERAAEWKKRGVVLD